MYLGQLRFVLVVAALPLVHTVQLHQHLINPHRAPTHFSEEKRRAHNQGRNATNSSRRGGAPQRLHSQKERVTSHLTSAGDIIHFLHSEDQEKPQKKGTGTGKSSATPLLNLSQGASHRQVAAPTSVVIMGSGSIDYAQDSLDQVPGPEPAIVSAASAYLPHLGQEPVEPAGVAVATTPAAETVPAVTLAPAGVVGTAATAAPVAGVASPAAAATTAPLVATVAPLAADPAAAAADPGVPATADTAAAAPAADADSGGGGGGFGIGMLFLILLVIAALGAAVVLVVKGRAKLSSPSRMNSLKPGLGAENEEPRGSSKDDGQFWKTAKSRQAERQSYRKSALLTSGLSSDGGGNDSDLFQSMEAPKSTSGVTGGASRSVATYKSGRGTKMGGGNANLSDPEAPESTPKTRGRGGRGGTMSMPLSQASDDLLLEQDDAKNDEDLGSKSRGTQGSYRGRRQLSRDARSASFKAEKAPVANQMDV